MISWPWDSALSVDEYDNPIYNRAYSSNVIATILKEYFGNGIFLDSADSLQVLADSGLNVTVNPGAGFMQGRHFYEETEQTLTHDTASALYDRIDAVVVRLNAAPSALNVIFDIVEGTPAASPAAPDLTRNSTVWEMALAYVTVHQSATEITQSDIEDMREDATVCGLSRLKLSSAKIAEINARLMDQLGYGVASGISITMSGDIDRSSYYASSQVTIGAGVVYLPDGTMCTVAETTFDVPGRAHPGGGGYDLIYVASDGTLTYLQDAASSLPITVPSGGVGIVGLPIETTDGSIILTAYAGDPDDNVDLRSYTDGSYIPSGTVLWENPNQTVAYTSTSEISIDLSLIKYVRIDFNTDPTKSSNVKMSTVLPVNGSTVAAVNIGGFDVYNELRPVTVQTTGVTFGSGKYITTPGSGGTTTSNTACVPIRIVKA